MVVVKIRKSKKANKRLVARFYSNGVKFKSVHFGSGNVMGRGTYVDHNDPKLKKAWIARHEVRGTFLDPYTPSALAYWVLWNKPTLKESIKSYKKKFGFN